MNRDEPPAQRHPCSCCGFLTLPKPPPGTFWICPVCDWEDDNIQFRDPNYEGGANKVSLAQARRNYAEIGASDPRRRERTAHRRRTSSHRAKLVPEERLPLGD